MSSLDNGSLLRASDDVMAASLLEALWEAPVALAVFDRELHLTRVNQAMQELNGLSEADHRGRGLPEVLPRLAPETHAVLRQVLQTGKAVVNLVYSGETEAVPGERRYWQGSCLPVRDRNHALIGLCVMVTEISALKRQEEETRRARAEAERAARWLEQLSQLSTALSKALTVQRVASVLLEVAMPLLGAQAGSVVATDGDQPRPLALRGFGEEPLRLFAGKRDQRPSPHLDAACSGNPVWIESKQASRKSYPAFTDLHDRLEFEAAAVAPLLIEGRAVGVVSFAFREPRSFAADDRAFILAMAGQTAQALERARLFEAEQRARARAEQNAMLLDTFIAATPCGLGFVDESLRFVKVNAALAALDGLSTEAHLGRPVSEVTVYPELRRAFECVAQTLEPLEAVAMTTCDRASGELRHWLASIFPICTHSGALAGVGSALTEVTAIRRAERERDESAQLLAEMLAAAPQGLALLDSQLRFVQVNAALAAFTGLPIEELLGRAAAGFFPIEHSAELEAQWRRTLEGGEPTVEYELRGQREGREWDCLASWFPLRAQGRVVGLGLMMRDVAEQRRTLELQRNVLGIVGFDVRNPLTAITTTAAHLLRGDGLGAPERHQVERILNGGRRIERIIDDLLDYTTTRTGGLLQLRPRPVQLPEICAAAVAQLEAGLESAAIEWHGEGDGSGEWDPAKLGQMVANLLSHALQGEGPGPVRLRWRGESGEVVLEVESEGPPVSADEREVLFEPFRRYGAQPPSGAGRGLELYLARQIALAHGGNLEVTSPPSAGRTVFTVRLPRLPALEERAGA